MSYAASTPEAEAQELMVEFDGDPEEAIKHLKKIEEAILDEVHAIQGFEEYKELKEVVNNE